MINKRNLGKKIKELRESNGLSQEKLAMKIKLSRAAVTQIETGNRSLEFLELAKIASIFNLKTDYFLYEEDLPSLNIKLEDTLYKFNPDKLRNVILYILQKCAGKPNLGETVLYKLLYFIDFDYFEINGQPMMGLNYVHLQFGPVPVLSEYAPVIETMKKNQELKIISQDYFGMRIKRYLNLIDYPANALDYNEIRIIDDVINLMSNWSARKIEEYAHGDAPWQLTNDRAVIHYNLVSERRGIYAKKDDELKYFSDFSARDILKSTGPISKEDYDYYENL